MRNCADRKRVVPNNGLAYTDNICARGSARFVVKGAPAQPVIQYRLSEIKVREVMRADNFSGGLIASRSALICPTRPWSEGNVEASGYAWVGSRAER